MEKSFWDERWTQGQLGFHLADANPRLVANLNQLGTGGRVLVPLCGKTLDMSFLASAGFEVVGIEFVEAAARAYFAEAGVQPARMEQDGFVGYQHGKVTIWVADVFLITPQVVGHVDAIYDRAALVALPENLRMQYGSKLASFCEAGARLVLVTFEHDLGSGPPFSLEPENVQRLFGASFSLELLERFDTFDESSRWKERGATRVSEAVWTGVRV